MRALGAVIEATANSLISGEGPRLTGRLLWSGRHAAMIFASASASSPLGHRRRELALANHLPNL
jgi:hypothetical protein